MRILIITWFFPPANTIGAVRLGGLVEHLLQSGHDVHVITPNEIPAEQTLDKAIDPSRIHRTPWSEPLSWVPRLWQRVARINGHSKQGYTQAQKHLPVGVAKASMRARLKKLVRDQVVFPDKSRGWIPFAVKAGRTLIRDWKPDLVFASGPPFSTLVVAHRVAAPARIPLICEFRDRWWDDPYYPPSRLCTWREKLLERRILNYSSGITTVSEPWAETYRARYKKPVQVVYNGFDSDEATSITEAGNELSDAFPVDTLNIVYTGGIYPGRRDPRPLFEALANHPDLRARVRVWFYGTAKEHVMPIAQETGVTGCIQLKPAVPHGQAVKLQHRADVLLLMQWNDPREQGNVPGKFFEYLGAGRPILLLGLRGGVPDQILRERNAGELANEPDAITIKLKSWLQLKDETGTVPHNPPAARAGFERREQFEKLRSFLNERASKLR